MFLVKVIYKCKAGSREAYYKEAFDVGIIDASKKDKGNLSYDYNFPVDSENDVLLLETWESPDDWEAHKGMPHVKELQAIKARHVLETSAEIFRLSPCNS